MYWCWRVPPVLSWCVRNKAMKYLSIFALLWPLSVWACDPAEFNVQAFLQANDHNRDGALQRSELVGPILAAVITAILNKTRLRKPFLPVWIQTAMAN